MLQGYSQILMHGTHDCVSERVTCLDPELYRLQWNTFIVPFHVKKGWPLSITFGKLFFRFEES